MEDEWWRLARVDERRTTTAKVVHTEIVSNKEIVLGNSTKKEVVHTENVSTEKVISDNPIEKKTESLRTTTAPEICTENILNKNRIGSKEDKNSNLNMNNSKEEEKEPEDVCSNLYGIAAADVAAAADDDDDINNVKLPLGCEDSIGYLDGIKDEYYQVERKSKDAEYWNEDIPAKINSSPRFANVRSPNIPNDGKILLLPLFSLVYRVEQADEIDNAKFQSSTVAVPTTAPVVISTETVSTKKVILDNPIGKKTESSTTTTAPEIVSNEEVVLNEICTESLSNKEAVRNLNAADDEIDNAKFRSSTATTTITTTAPEIRRHILLNEEVVSNMNVVLKEDANSNWNVVEVDDEYWKEERNNPIIVTDSPNPENKSSQRILDNFDSIVQNYDDDEENKVLRFYIRSI